MFVNNLAFQLLQKKKKKTGGLSTAPSLSRVSMKRFRIRWSGRNQRPVSVVDRAMSILWYAEDFDKVAGKDPERADLVKRLRHTSSTHQMEVNLQKMKPMSSGKDGISMNTSDEGENLETVAGFRYMRSITL